MSEVEKISLAKIRQHFCDAGYGLICNSSFEARCLSIPRELAHLENIHLGAFSLSGDVDVEGNTQALVHAYSDSKVSVVPVDSRSPFDWSASISRLIDLFVEMGVKRLAVDVTTFTHESLLILIKHLSDIRGFFEKIVFLYLGASDYSPSEKDPRNKWLTKGCRDLRTVLGYPGWMKPSCPTCLTVLVGYEHERATRMITEMEPDLLYLGGGIGKDEHVTHENHKGPMAHFNELVREMVSTRYNVRTFDFSCSKPIDTVSSIQRIIEETPSHNHIVVPLNTKISTIAAATVALKNRDIQLCYAEPETYNTEDYATPGDEVSKWEFEF